MDKQQIDEIKKTANLVDLADRAGVELKQYGQTWRGRCPFHGGDNPTSFVIMSGDQGQRWHCFAGCGSGDVIEFVKRIYHLSFAGALARLGGEDHPLPRLTPATITHRPADPPDRFWQIRARRLIERAKSVLWSPNGEHARTYLHGRGLSPQTIREFELGLIPVDCYDRPELWGLAGKNIWLPKGIVIPTIQDQFIWAINIRRPAGIPKYYKIRGSQFALFGKITGLPDIIFAEGEFDAALLYQEAGDLADVATAGATKFIPRGRWITPLLVKRRIIAVVDNDPAGIAAITKWGEFSQRASIVKPPTGKDITEFHLAGGDLRYWAKTILGLTTADPPPPVIRQKQTTLPILDMFDYVAACGLEITNIDCSVSPPVVEWREKKELP